MNNVEEIHNYLSSFTSFFRDPIWKNIYFPRVYYKIFSNATFFRLSSLRQLGPVYLIYPGAMHTRFSHSLGVYHISFLIIQNLLYKDSVSFLSLQGVKAFLLASLLHDLGHYPYAHTLEGLDIFKRHELLSCAYLDNPDLKKILEDILEGSINLIKLILLPSIENENLIEKEFKLYRSILSNSIDSDKLDYLNRDAFFCGIPYGIQDVSFIISQLGVEAGELAISDKGSSSLNNILFSKYNMYQSVYWHQKVRLCSAIVYRKCREAIHQNIIKQDNIYLMTDDEFVHFFEKNLLNGKLLISLVDDYFVLDLGPINSFSSQCQEKIKKENVRIEYENKIKKFLFQYYPDLDDKYILILDYRHEISFDVRFRILGKSQRKLLLSHLNEMLLSDLQKIFIIFPKSIKIDRSMQEKIIKTILI